MYERCAELLLPTAVATLIGGPTLCTYVCRAFADTVRIHLLCTDAEERVAKRLRRLRYNMKGMITIGGCVVCEEHETQSTVATPAAAEERLRKPAASLAAFGFLRHASLIIALRWTHVCAQSKIGCGCLEMCTSLRSLDLTGLSRITTIGSSFGAQCAALTEVDMSPLRNVETIGDDCFRGCASLHAFRWSAATALSVVGDDFVACCVALKVVDVEGLCRVKTVGHKFFAHCTSLEAIDLSPLRSVASVGHGLLFFCESLRTVTWTMEAQPPTGLLLSVGNGPLAGCKSLEVVVLPEAVRAKRDEWLAMERNISRGADGNV